MRAPGRPSPFVALSLYLLAAMGLWAVGFGSEGFLSLVRRAWPDLTPEWAGLLVNLVYYGLFLLLPLAALCGRSFDAAALRLNPIPRGATIRAIAVALLCVFFVDDLSLFWSIFWQKLGLCAPDAYVRPVGSGELSRSVLSAAFVAVVGEEALFRGALLSAWETRGRKSAALTTAALFAILHGSLLGLPGEFFGGLVMALLTMWTDSLYVSMIFHSVYNAALILLSYVASGMTPTPESTDLVAVVGGAAGLVSMAFEAALIGLPLYFLLRSFRRRAPAAEPPVPGKLSVGESVTLMAGIVSALGLYVMDVLQALGGAP